MKGVKAFNKILLIVLVLSLFLSFQTIPKVKATPTILTYTSSDSDGDIRSSDADYGTARNSTMGDEIENETVCLTVGQNEMLGDYNVWRAFFFFDTSSIPDNANITEAIFSFYIGTSGTAEINIVNGMPTYPHDPLELGDFDKDNYTGNGGSFNCSGQGTGYKNLTLNVQGRSWINKTAVTKFCLRSTQDLNNIAPTGDKYVGIYCLEKGVNYVAKLYVTYEAAQLTINSAPSSVSFTLNGTSKTTPYSEKIVAGTYQINFTPSFYRDAGLWTFQYWADTKSTNPNRTINLQSDASYSVVYTWTYVAPTILTLKCDGHTETFTDWSAVGERTDALKEPNDGNYVYENVNGLKEGNFTFEDTSATGPVNSVVLKLYTKSYYASEGQKVYVYNGSWVLKTAPRIESTLAWVSIDVSDTLTSWTKINNAKICLEVVGAYTWTVDAAKILVNPNVVHLHGLFDEDTGLMKSASERAVNVTVVLPGYVHESYVLNGSLDVAWITPILYIQFNTSVPRQYWFSSAETGTGDPVTIYVFDTSLTSYTISFLDLAGLLDDYPFVSAKRHINGSLTIVEKRKVDAEDKVVMALKNGEKYSIIISDGVIGEAYVFGDLTVTSVTILQLTLRGVDFPKATLLIYKYVRIYGDRAHGTPYGNITIFYQDLLNKTNNVQIYIDYKNGTNVYYAIITSNSSFIHVWASALNNTDYQVEVIIDHQKYGVYTWRQYFPRSLSKNPWGLGWFGNLGFDAAIIIPFFLILFVGGCFSTINAEVGAVAMVITAIIVVYMWGLPIAPATLIVALTLAFCMAIIYAKRRVQT